MFSGDRLIEVFPPGTSYRRGQPIEQVKRRDAQDYVKRGMATWANHARAIVLKQVLPEFMPRTLEQYAQIGIESHPLMVSGGLVRNESQPRKFQPKLDQKARATWPVRA